MLTLNRGGLRNGSDVHNGCFVEEVLRMGL